MASRILAIGGGGFLMEESPSPIDRYLVQLLDRNRPRICLVATPSGDSVEMTCLGLLAGGCCAHYSEPERRAMLRQEIEGSDAGTWVAIDDGAAILYRGTEIEATLRWQPGAGAYRVFARQGLVVEEPLSAQAIA